MHHPHPSPPPKNGQKSRCLSWDSTKIRGGESVSFGGWEHQQILYLPVFLCHEKEDFGRYLPKNFVRFKVLTSKQRNSLFGGFKFSIWIIGSCQRCLKEPQVENPCGKTRWSKGRRHFWHLWRWGPGSFSMGFSASPNVLKHWQTLQEFQTKSNV